MPYYRLYKNYGPSYRDVTIGLWTHVLKTQISAVAILDFQSQK